jgi:hypothetical protein
MGENIFLSFLQKYDGLLDFITRNKGKVKSLKLTLYGTKEMPPHYSTERTYEGLDSE